VQRPEPASAADAVIDEMSREKHKTHKKTFENRPSGADHFPLFVSAPRRLCGLE
jgi:hypothetical protein